mmetsp:Transcript_67057/g.143488  ORF Transcript_67057/g.143488 Transcript_67057/m.143488 type:complete len:208 (+) Transcript_67057:396-1019(+)
MIAAPTGHSRTLSEGAGLLKESFGASQREDPHESVVRNGGSKIRPHERDSERVELKTEGTPSLAALTVRLNTISVLTRNHTEHISDGLHQLLHAPIPKRHRGPVEPRVHGAPSNHVDALEAECEGLAELEQALVGLRALVHLHERRHREVANGIEQWGEHGPPQVRALAIEALQVYAVKREQRREHIATSVNFCLKVRATHLHRGHL